MKKYTVIVDSLSFRGKVYKKNKPIKLSDEDSKHLLKIKAIELEGKKTEPEKPKPEKKEA